MTAKKSAKKTAKRVPKGIPRGTPMTMPNGAILIAGAGNGPKKGAPNAGRPPDQWKAALRALADREAVLDHINAALLAGPRRAKLGEDGNPIADQYIGSAFFEDALQYVTDHGYGKATQPVAHSGSIGLVELLEAAHASTDPT